MSKKRTNNRYQNSFLAQLLILFCLLPFIFEVGAFANPPLEPSKDDCRFYLELKAQRSCYLNKEAPSDYLVFYGYKYCRTFLDARDGFDLETRTWIEDTTKCLQESLLPSQTAGLNCQELERVAFDSHPEYYVEAGFCELNSFQRFRILRQLHCWDLVKRTGQSFRQLAAVLFRCGFDQVELDAILGVPFSCDLI